MARKHDPEFTKLLLSCARLDRTTGSISFDGLYANFAINIGFKGQLVVVPYSHIVWLLDKGKWPTEGFVLDHINDDATDNRPTNLQEITQEENQKKRRGRLVYRSYGKGKYGHGINIYNDKRDGRFYITRQLSRGHGDGDLKSIKKGFGGYPSLVEAENRVKEIIRDIKKFGPRFGFD